MLAYTARMLGYSFITDPTYVFPFEALEGLTMALMMTSAVTYVAKISSTNTISSVMGLMGALFFGIGKGSGSLFGGLLMSVIGAANTFRSFAVTSLVCSVAYGFFQCLYIKPKRSVSPDESVNSSDNQDSHSTESQSRGRDGISNEAFHKNGSTVNESSSSSTLRSETKIGKFFMNRFSDFSQPPQPPSPPSIRCHSPSVQKGDQSPITTIKFSTEPRSITGGTRV